MRLDQGKSRGLGRYGGEARLDMRLRHQRERSLGKHPGRLIKVDPLLAKRKRKKSAKAESPRGASLSSRRVSHAGSRPPCATALHTVPDAPLFKVLTPPLSPLLCFFLLARSHLSPSSSPFTFHRHCLRPQGLQAHLLHWDRERISHRRRAST